MATGYYIRGGNKPSYTFEADKVARENKLSRYTTFVEQVKEYYLSEALAHILDKCCVSEGTDMVGYGTEICRRFVKEEGYDTLMRRFKSSTHTLAMIEQCVREACENTLCKTDKENELTYSIMDTDQKKFFDTLSKIPANKLADEVNKRVCAAAEEFVQRNVSAKVKIEEIAGKAKERIDAAKAKHDEAKAEQIQKEQMQMYKREVDSIKNSGTRNVYEQMMTLASKSILESEELRDKYIGESGQFDMGKVERQVKIMYTFLEMVNSLKIKKVDNKYIEECLSSIN